MIRSSIRTAFARFFSQIVFTLLAPDFPTAVGRFVP
jgi:hypothetical protein